MIQSFSIATSLALLFMFFGGSIPGTEFIFLLAAGLAMIYTLFIFLCFAMTISSLDKKKSKGSIELYEKMESDPRLNEGLTHLLISIVTTIGCMIGVFVHPFVGVFLIFSYSFSFLNSQWVDRYIERNYSIAIVKELYNK